MSTTKGSKKTGSTQIKNKIGEEHIKRGDVYTINLDPTQDSEIGKTRPCVIIQNDIGNKFSPVVIIAPISSVKEITKPLPVMVFIIKGDGGLKEDSYADLGQIRTVSKNRCIKKSGSLSGPIMREIDKAIKISLSLN